MFVGSSIIVAILSGEDDADELLGRLKSAGRRMTSALVLLESVMRLSSKLRVEPMDAESVVLRFLDRFDVAIVSIGATEGGLAIEAFSRFGKGRGHPAQLNLADCLSYACAKALSVPLFYKGDDFSQTDLA
jgi:ribonuclease VapC